MSHTDTILNYLIKNKFLICDDCLSAKTNIRPRQQVNQIVNKLAKDTKIKRQKNSLKCSLCKAIKYLNSFQ